MSGSEKPKKYEHTLMRALSYDEDDLAANANGAWSERQIAKMRRERRDLLVELAILTVPPILLGAFLARASSIAPFGVLIGFALVLLVYATNFYRLTRDLRGTVRAVEGRIQLDVIPRRKRAIYTARINGVKFKIKKAAFLSFKNGDPYRVYYAPHRKQIASAEWLRDDDPFEERARLEAEESYDTSADAKAVHRKRL